MNIGLLLPRSVLYPSIAFDINDGLKMGLINMGIKDEHTITSTSIGVAAKNEEVRAKCEQLLLEGAELIVGYMNPMTAEYIQPLFASVGARLLVLDSGYHFTPFENKLPNVYFISLQGNLCCRAIARKALDEQMHKNIAFTCSFYDAGYRPSYTYAMSVEERGSQIGFHHITSLKRSDFTLDPLAQYLDNNKDAAVFASFCGDMAEDFFRESARLNLITNHKTYASGFTAEETYLSKIPYPGNDWSCAVPWSVKIETPANTEFVSTLNKTRADKANIFSLLGWEAALFVAATTGAGAQQPDGLELDSPRGALFIDPQTGYAIAPVYYASVVKNETTGNSQLDRISVALDLEGERKNLEKDSNALRNVQTNSWLNAYACLDS